MKDYKCQCVGNFSGPLCEYHNICGFESEYDYCHGRGHCQSVASGEAVCTCDGLYYWIWESYKKMILSLENYKDFDQILVKIKLLERLHHHNAQRRRVVCSWE